MDLVRFDPSLSAQVSGWARTATDTLAWCSRAEAPVPAEVIAEWGRARDVIAYGLVEGDDLIGYGELWVDRDGAEVELARLIVAPDRRGQDVGRRLAVALANEALRIHHVVFLRVRPDNGAALRCYAAAGFRRVAPEEETGWNTHQPVAYVWLSYDRDGTVLFEGDVQ